MYTWLHCMLQPANEHIRLLTDGERNFHGAFVKEEDKMSFAMQLQQKVDGGRPSWRILLSELKHKAGEMHKKVRFIG